MFHVVCCILNLQAMTPVMMSSSKHFSLVSSTVKKNMGVEEKVQEVVHNAAFNAFYEEQSAASQEKLRKKKIRSKVERDADGAVKSTIESLVTDFKPKR